MRFRQDRLARIQAGMRAQSLAVIHVRDHDGEREQVSSDEDVDQVSAAGGIALHACTDDPIVRVR